ncbi:MAG: pteridine reductase [Cellvibrionaceae bacterium]
MTAETPVALITGGARRIGAKIATQLHASGYNLVIHYRNSSSDAQALADQLNSSRNHSVVLIAADLANFSDITRLSNKAVAAFGRLDALINNASSFYPTPVNAATEDQWDDLFSSNAKAPFFLSQALSNALKKSRGCIVNIADIHAQKPLKEHTLYCMAKAANVMLTQSLAKELAPQVRVNGIAPGAIMWPEQAAELSQENQQAIIEKIPLDRPGKPQDIAKTVSYLLDSDYLTGQIIAVDGGRSVN